MLLCKQSYLSHEGKNQNKKVKNLKKKFANLQKLLLSFQLIIDHI